MLPVRVGVPVQVVEQARAEREPVAVLPEEAWQVERERVPAQQEREQQPVEARVLFLQEPVRVRRLRHQQHRPRSEQRQY